MKSFVSFLFVVLFSIGCFASKSEEKNSGKVEIDRIDLYEWPTSELNSIKELAAEILCSEIGREKVDSLMNARFENYNGPREWKISIYASGEGFQFDYSPLSPTYLSPYYFCSSNHRKKMNKGWFTSRGATFDGKLVRIKSRETGEEETYQAFDALCSSDNFIQQCGARLYLFYPELLNKEALTQASEIVQSSDGIEIVRCSTEMLVSSGQDFDQVISKGLKDSAWVHRRAIVRGLHRGDVDSKKTFDVVFEALKDETDDDVKACFISLASYHFDEPPMKNNFAGWLRPLDLL